MSIVINLSIYLSIYLMIWILSAHPQLCWFSISVSALAVIGVYLFWLLSTGIHKCINVCGGDVVHWLILLWLLGLLSWDVIHWLTWLRFAKERLQSRITWQHARWLQVNWYKLNISGSILGICKFSLSFPVMISIIYVTNRDYLHFNIKILILFILKLYCQENSPQFGATCSSTVVFQCSDITADVALMIWP